MESINSKAVIRYEVDLETLVKNIVEDINKSFQIQKQVFQIITHKNVENMEQNISTISKDFIREPIFSIYEFVKSLAN